MDFAAAFPSMARGCLLRKMRDRGLDECLVRWTDSFMRDRGYHTLCLQAYLERRGRRRG